MKNCLDQRIKIKGKCGWLRWSPRGYWSLNLTGFTSNEELEEKFSRPTNGEYDAGAMEAAKERLLARARAHFKAKKERK